MAPYLPVLSSVLVCVCKTIPEGVPLRNNDLIVVMGNYLCIKIEYMYNPNVCNMNEGMYEI